jgi:hypothetical protein
VETSLVRTSSIVLPGVNYTVEDVEVKVKDFGATTTATSPSVDMTSFCLDMEYIDVIVLLSF